MASGERISMNVASEVDAIAENFHNGFQFYRLKAVSFMMLYLSSCQIKNLWDGLRPMHDLPKDLEGLETVAGQEQWRWPCF